MTYTYQMSEPDIPAGAETELLWRHRLDWTEGGTVVLLDIIATPGSQEVWIVATASSPRKAAVTRGTLGGDILRIDLDSRNFMTGRIAQVVFGALVALDSRALISNEKKRKAIIRDIRANLPIDRPLRKAH